MTDLQLILLILGIASAAWQLFSFAWAVKVANGNNHVNIGIVPGLVAVALFIAVVLL